MSDDIKKYMRELKEEFSQENQRYWEKNEKQNLKLKEEFSQEAQRYIGVIAEDFQHKLDVVVEGHQVLSKKIDDLRYELKSEIRGVAEVVKLSHRELTKKDNALELEVSKLKTRVEKLETAHP